METAKELLLHALKQESAVRQKIYIEAALSRALREGENDLFAFLRGALGMPPAGAKPATKNVSEAEAKATTPEKKQKKAEFKPYTCACGRKFASRQALSGHKRSCKK
ncbi:MAG: hypothetical protein KatS3mg033_1915 [Thermonema sp.]|uniref:hypothetical protein n=1 Tax=Thermonema sp. TaxID=2231181 RepID=UPI0021DF14A1|nr:hypothetical protein [Thermonema sp.]GIV40115.1 MAG: hypothetical protein KatS3mg033_1915 [Thermonema sp.]